MSNETREGKQGEGIEGRHREKESEMAVLPQGEKMNCICSKSRLCRLVSCICIYISKERGKEGRGKAREA